jgi:hypothetical protein
MKSFEKCEIFFLFFFNTDGKVIVRKRIKNLKWNWRKKEISSVNLRKL